MDRTATFRRAYQFLVDRERQGATFTVLELAAAAGWKKESAATNLSKKLKLLVERSSTGYRPQGVTAYAEEEFVRLMSQTQAVSANPKKPDLEPPVEALLHKARQAALLALQVYNNPTTTFRTEGFIVLMVIAWTSLLHAIFERRRENYFYKTETGAYRVVDGERKAWELTECIKQFFGSSACGVRSNLEFSIKLRNRIEHRFAPGIDPHVVGECQALLLNFDELLTAEFGSYFAIRESLAVPLQTATVRQPEQAKALRSLQANHLEEIREFVDAFRAAQSDTIQDDPHFRFRVYLVPKIGNHASADAAIEFVPYDPSNPGMYAEIAKQVAIIREKRVPVATANFLPKMVMKTVASRLGRTFTMDTHTRAWKKYGARPRGVSLTGCDERYCVPDPAHGDYLYTQAWIDFLVNRLSDDAEYEAVRSFKG